MKDYLIELADRWFHPKKVHERDRREIISALESLREEGVLEAGSYTIAWRAQELSHPGNLSALLPSGAVFRVLVELRKEGKVQSREETIGDPPETVGFYYSLTEKPPE